MKVYFTVLDRKNSCKPTGERYLCEIDLLPPVGSLIHVDDKEHKPVTLIVMDAPIAFTLMRNEAYPYMLGTIAVEKMFNS